MYTALISPKVGKIAYNVSSKLIVMYFKPNNPPVKTPTKLNIAMYAVKIMWVQFCPPVAFSSGQIKNQANTR